MTDLTPERDLHGAITIDATPRQVWSALTDPGVMAKASPELFATTRTRKGPLQLGETFIGWNRRGAVIWPTMNTVTRAEPERELTWHTRTSGATWTYTLIAEGRRTIVEERRHISRGVSLVSKIFATALLGGSTRHANELDTHVPRTLREIKAIAESRA